MKKILFIATALMTVMVTNAQEVCEFNPNNSLTLDADNGTKLEKGTIIGETASIVATIGDECNYKPQTVSFTLNGKDYQGGLQGDTNPKDIDGINTSISLKEPITGAFLKFKAKADGFLYVIHKALSNKAYTVFEEGKAISYTFSAIGDASTDLGAVYQFTLPYEVKNGQFVVKESIDWAEREYLKASAPEKYDAHWSEDDNGTKVWDPIKVNGLSVIKFPVYEGFEYIVNTNGAKIIAAGYAFSTHDDVTIKSGDITIYSGNGDSPGEKPQINQNIVFADAAVKALCVANWDTDGDGELSKAEAAAVTNLGTVFYNSKISSFDELAYFTGLTSIENNTFENCIALTSVTIPNSVTTIGSHAFADCWSLTSITIPNSVTSIGEWAFWNCSGLTSVTIPKSVTSIGFCVFNNCSGLSSLTVESGNTMYDSRENCNAIIETSTNKLVFGCKNTIIPNSVTSIGNSAFYGCSGLTSIDIPNSVTSIGNAAFCGCSGLTSITIPKSITIIDGFAFSSCYGLSSISVDSGNIKYDSRDNCNAIIDTSTNKLVFGFKKTVIPNSVTSIGANAFSGCKNMTAITIPNSVKSIETYAFNDCSGLTSVTIPNSVTSMGIGAFSGCSGLTSVTIPNSITLIDRSAFYQCNGLTSVTSMISEPFNIYEDVFESNVYQNATLTIPYGSKAKYEAAEGWNKFSNIEQSNIISFADATVKTLCVANWDTDGDGELNIDEAVAVTNLGTVFKGNMTIKSFDELAYFTGLTSIDNQAFSGCIYLTSVKIPNSVTSIGENSFWDCIDLTSVTIPNSVTSIGEYAFSICTSLASVTIPNSVYSIGERAFMSCIGLTSVTIPNSVRSIGEGAFLGCQGLTNIVVEDENTIYDSREGCNAIIRKNGNELIAGCKNTIIPNSVTSIGNFAFSSVIGLSFVTIPNSVTSIGEGAFEGCRGLKTVTIPSCVTSIGSKAFYSCNGLTSVTSMLSEPFNINENVFDSDVYQNATLTIPYGSKAKYEAAEGWNKFSNKKESAGNVDPNDIISFADATVKALCVANWDTDGDGELSKTESAAVVNFNKVFRYKQKITSFDELQYFTGLLSIDDEAFSGCYSLTSVIIPNSVTNIGGSAFSGCSGLTSVTIPSSVTSIGWDAYKNCSGLTSVTIPNSVTTIGVSAFFGCSGLTSVTIPNSVTSIGDFAFSGCSGLTSIMVESGNGYYDSRNDCNAIIETSSNTLIAGCNNTIIPNGVTSIGQGAFYGCSCLTSITIPEGVTTISNYAFGWCSGLTSVIIPNSVTKLCNEAFYRCDNLESLVIPEHITKRTIHVEKTGTLSSLIPTDEKYVIEELTLTGELNGSDLGLLRDMAGGGDFETMDVGIIADGTSGHLRVLDISDVNIVAGGSYVDYIINEDDGRWRNLPEYLSLSNDNVIPDLLFCGCGRLTDIKLPNSVTAIGSYAFARKHYLDFYTEGLSNLTSVVIGSNVVSIGDNAFDGCSSLTSLTVYIQEPLAISANTFSNRVNTTLYVPKGSKTAYEAADYWKEVKEIKEFANEDAIKRTIHVATAGTLSNLISEEEKYQIEELTLTGELSGADFKLIREMAGCNFAGYYTEGKLKTLSMVNAKIVRDVDNNRVMYIHTDDDSDLGPMCNDRDGMIEEDNIIPNDLFLGCRSLTSVILPKTVTSIDRGAFERCSSLTSIVIPNSVTSIDNSAFSRCTNLTSVTVYIQEPLAITASIFSNHANATLYVPKGCKAAYEAADYWKEFKEIKEFVKDNEVTCVIEDNNTVTATAANDPSEKDIVIPESVIIDGEAYPVTAIGDEAFKDNTSLTLVCIPETIEEIGEDAFAGCSGLTAIYSYTEDPVPLSSDKAMVRTRADDNEVNASNVFAKVDKEKCILYVPKGCAEKYGSAEGWKEFKNIVEMESNTLGDANNDAKVDSKDIDATVDYIMEGKTKDFIFKNADVKTDSKINAADIVEIVNIKK